MPVLEADGISVRFGGVQAVRDVSVHVGEWEVVGIIGPNGAGKTTLFNVLTGFQRPNTGRVRFEGDDITGEPVHRRAALGMGRTFQNVGLVKAATVLDNLLTAQHMAVGYGAVAGIVGSSLAFERERAVRDEAARLLELLGLLPVADLVAGRLPYGLRKQVELATVLATHPKVLLLDEPTSGMGPEEAEAFGERLLALRRELGLSVLMIEHHVPLVAAVCDYVYCMNFGELLVEGKPDDVRSHPEVVRAYLGDEAA
ncbi:MAG: ABC transporter ATP-binding protein [Acidobacteria bacterium]|nr:ABC transporter ATP-binding protein [Acidobacteriota bacterium]